MYVIGFWSSVHGQAKVSASCAAVAEALADEKTRVCVTHSQYDRAGLDRIMQGQSVIKEDDEYGLAKMSKGLSALLNRKRAEVLTPEIVERCCYKPNKRKELYHLAGIQEEYEVGDENKCIFEMICQNVKNTFDYTLVDLAAGYQNSLTKSLLRACDLIVVCLSQSEEVYGKFFKEGFPEFDYEMGDVDYAHPNRAYEPDELKETDYQIERPYIVLYGGYLHQSATKRQNLEAKYKVDSCAVPLIPEYMDAIDSVGAPTFFLNNENAKGEVGYFMKEVQYAAGLIKKHTGGIRK